MRTCILLLSTFVSLGAACQCDPGNLYQQEYSWKKITDAQPGLAGKFLAAESGIVRNMAQLLINRYPKPKGGEAFWYGNYQGNWYLPGQYAKAFTSISFLKPYLCVNGQPKLNGEYETSVFIEINGFGFLSGSVSLNNHEYRSLPAKMENRNGGLYLRSNDDYHIKESWLLTYPGQLPGMYLTRKEYLTELRAHKTNLFNARIKGITDAATIADIRSFYDKDIEKIDRTLNNSSADYLSKPAVVQSYTIEIFNNFEESEKGPAGVYLLKNNPAYFNTKLPVTSPQYISVIIRHHVTRIPDKNFNDAVNQPSLIGDLQSLLGK